MGELLMLILGVIAGAILTWAALTDFGRER